MFYYVHFVINSAWRKTAKIFLFCVFFALQAAWKIIKRVVRPETDFRDQKCQEIIFDSERQIGFSFSFCSGFVVFFFVFFSQVIKVFCGFN